MAMVCQVSKQDLNSGFELEQKMAWAEEARTLQFSNA